MTRNSHKCFCTRMFTAALFFLNLLIYLFGCAGSDDQSLPESELGVGNKDKSDMRPIFVKLTVQRGDEDEIYNPRTTLFSVSYNR